MWTTVGEIGEVVTGCTPSKDNKEYYGGNIPFFKPTDLEQGIDTKSSNDKLTQLGYDTSRKLPAYSVLVTCIGATIGKTGLISVEGACNQQINAIVPSTSIIPHFVYFACISKYMQNEIISKASATTLPILNKGNFSKIAFPLPPLKEQKRIVSEIRNWISLVNIVEKGKSDLLATISQTKSKILDLAVHGKLVSQDPSDEPASELLKRINPKAEITCDNPRYVKLPKGWVMTKVKSVFNINPKNTADNTQKAGFVPMANICDGYGNHFSYITKDWGKIKSGFTHFSDGDIAVAKISPCLENRKSMVLRNLPNGIGAGTTELYVFRPISVDALYGLYFFKSDYFINNCIGTFNGVVGQQRVSKSIVEDILLPLPPLFEQHRIVAKIEGLFSQLDMIESSL